MKAAYNTAVTTELQRLMDPLASPRNFNYGAVPARPCKPDRPYLYTGPDIQWTNTWTAIKASATFRGEGQGAVVSRVGQQSSWLQASTDTGRTSLADGCFAATPTGNCQMTTTGVDDGIRYT